MKLVLCSEGFRTNNTVQACVELCAKPQNKISVAIINEAYAVDAGGHRWVVDNLNDVANNFPAELDIVNLLALSLDEVEARIMAKDAIFVVGGNIDYLMHVFQKTGFASLLPRLLETKVYVGSSAGSIVMGKRPPLAAKQKIYGESQDFGVNEYLGLVDFGIFSHLNSPNFPNNRPAVLDELASGAGFPIYALMDDSAIVINGDERSFIGSEPHEVHSSNGHRLSRIKE